MKVKLGDTITGRKVFRQEDFDAFATLSGDDNPIHVDPDFSARTRFGKTVAHGMLLYGILCGLLSKHFPLAVQLEQELMFPAPTYSGQEITIMAKVVELQARQSKARLATLIFNPDGDTVCDGHTILWWPES
jgi:3-hydroxybutyryl-CoA dehydratase